MYIEPTNRYYADGQQRIGRGRFLILMQRKDGDIGCKNMRGIVRKVVMRQLGHWMMGCARIANETVTLSGSYGSDGLPCSVSDNVYSKGIDIPSDLCEKWAKGGGWNSCGDEAQAMREWALETFK